MLYTVFHYCWRIYYCNYLFCGDISCVLNDNGYVPLVVSNSRSFPHSRLITGFVTKLTLRVQLVEQELPTIPEHLNSPPPVYSGVRVTQSLVWCVCFVNRCLCICPFSLGHCVVCSSSRYGFWLSLWYLQTILVPNLIVYLAIKYA